MLAAVANNNNQSVPPASVAANLTINLPAVVRVARISNYGPVLGVCAALDYFGGMASAIIVMVSSRERLDALRGGITANVHRRRSDRDQEDDPRTER